VKSCDVRDGDDFRPAGETVDCSRQPPDCEPAGLPCVGSRVTVSRPEDR
jgi:hypothetical protein